MAQTIKFVDTTIRDGQASLWAMNMATRHLTPIMPNLDRAGFDAIEFVAPASRLKKFVKDLKENPWDWIHAGVRDSHETPLRWHSDISGLKMLNAHVPDVIAELLYKRIVDLGITTTRTGNNWNNFDALAVQMKRLDEIGMIAVVHVMYSVSPKHTDEYFIQKAREAAALNPWRMCFKDVSGMLTPERTRDLLPKMMAVSGNLPWEFHGHCNNGLGPLNALEAVKCGVEYVHTSIPPLANGASQPSITNMATNLEALGYDAPIDLDALAPITDFLTYVAQRESLPIGMPAEYDQRLYTHQVPGGMISNLVFQLEKVGMGDRLDEVLEEIPRVRADFGYPIMVTPLSQFVGSQAAINVIVGERYKQVTDETIQYALGKHGGDEATTSMDPEVRAKILDRPRAREIGDIEIEQPTLAEVRQRYGISLSDEELILRVLLGNEAIDALPPTRMGSRGLSANWPMVELLRELTAPTAPRYVSIRHDNFSLTVNRR